MPALSIATSVPVPMAMPTSAARKGGRVVDPVARHGDDAALVSQALDHRGLVLGEDLGDHLVDAQLAADGFGRGLAVAREHHDADARRLQRLQRLRRRGLDGVGNGHEAGQLAVHADEDDRGRLRALRFRRLQPGSPRRCRARPGTWRCPRRPELPSTVPTTPLPTGESKSVTGDSASLRSCASVDDGHRQRVLAGSLDAGELLQDVSGREPGRRLDVDDLRPALGQRAGLVDHQRVDLLHALERLGVADQHAVLRAAADADHDGHRRGQARAHRDRQ